MTTFRIVLVSFLAAFIPVAVAQDTSVNYKEIAHKIVTVSAHVKPGEKVLINGGQHMLPLMEALAMEIDNAGGDSLMIFNSDAVVHNYLANIKDEYIRPSPWSTELFKVVDVSILLPQVQDLKAVSEGVSQERLNKFTAAGAALNKARNESKVRIISISVPGPHDAEYVQMEKAAYDKMQWDAINADYSQIVERGNQLKQLLSHAKSVKITSPTGTSFTLSPGGRPIFVNAGIAQPTPGLIYGRRADLPGGLVAFAPLETSGNGKFVVPKDTCQPYEPLKGATYEFSNGKLTSFKAEQNGKCFEDMRAAAIGTGGDMLANVLIGLNPALKVNEDTADYRDANSAGMVSVGIGANETLGGANRTTMGWSIPVTKATVEIDGKVVIKDGQFTM